MIAIVIPLNTYVMQSVTEVHMRRNSFVLLNAWRATVVDFLRNTTQLKAIIVFCMVWVHSQYWYSIWEWIYHSITAAMGFPLRDKTTGGYFFWKCPDYQPAYTHGSINFAGELNTLLPECTCWIPAYKLACFMPRLSTTTERISCCSRLPDILLISGHELLLQCHIDLHSIKVSFHNPKAPGRKCTWNMMIALTQS